MIFMEVALGSDATAQRTMRDWIQRQAQVRVIVVLGLVTASRWAVGTFCAAMGVLMLVAPHQFNWPAFAWLQGQLTWWGLGFLAAGVGLLVILEGLLSADNALVVAVMILGLPRPEQQKALRYGLLGAFVNLDHAPPDR